MYLRKQHYAALQTFSPNNKHVSAPIFNPGPKQGRDVIRWYTGANIPRDNMHSKGNKGNCKLNVHFKINYMNPTLAATVSSKEAFQLKWNGIS